MSQNLPVNGFKWVEEISQFNEDFIKTYNVKSDERYIEVEIEVDVQYLEKLPKLNNALPFLLERIKIEKVEKLVVNLHHKREYVIRIRNLKQALNHGLVL